MVLDAPVTCMIEIAKGSRNRYEPDPPARRDQAGSIHLGLVVYPTDYGFVPKTLAPDYALRSATSSRSTRTSTPPGIPKSRVGAIEGRSGWRSTRRGSDIRSIAGLLAHRAAPSTETIPPPQKGETLGAIFLARDATTLRAAGLGRSIRPGLLRLHLVHWLLASVALAWQLRGYAEDAPSKPRRRAQ